MTFLNAALLPALLLASVPIIIHLFFRRQYQRIDWAPMKYLQLTIRRNRRRLQIEQLILLLLRILAVGLIIFAVCRPVLSDSGLIGWLASRGRTARIIVIDDSLSMGYSVEGHSAFAAARKLSQEVVDNLKAEDTLTILLTSRPDEPLVNSVHVDDPGPIKTLLADLTVTHTPSNWLQAFTAVNTVLEATPQPIREVTLLTDMRYSGWTEELATLTGRWDEQDVEIRVVDLGSERVDNVAILALEEAAAIALPGAPVRLTARLRNDSDTTMTDIQAILTVDDQSRPVIIPELAPGVVTELDLEATFEQPGDHLVSLTLPRDVLNEDNQRWRLVTVREQLDILLVDGEPNSEAFASETDFLSLSLGVGDMPWQVRQTIDTDWLNAAPLTPDLLVLANVSTITERRAEILSRQVHDGMGLMVFPGDLVDPQVYNQYLYNNGAGVLPAQFERTLEGPVTGLLVVPHEDSPLDQLSGIAASALGGISARRYAGFSMIDDARRGVRVLATWNDPLRSPVAVEHRHGKGRVILWSITADRTWSDWPVDPTYVLAVREAAMGTARPTIDDRTIDAGGELLVKIADSANLQDPRVIVPGSGDSRAATAVEAGLSIADTAYAGVYALEWMDPAGKRQQAKAAVNPAAAESDLGRLADDQLRTCLGSLEPTIVHQGNSGAELGDESNEIWRNLALLVLALLFSESAMALWIGRYR